jgi:hypothetical protein
MPTVIGKLPIAQYEFKKILKILLFPLRKGRDIIGGLAGENS